MTLSGSKRLYLQDISIIVKHIQSLSRTISGIRISMKNSQVVTCYMIFISSSEKCHLEAISSLNVPCAAIS